MHHHPELDGIIRDVIGPEQRAISLSQLREIARRYADCDAVRREHGRSLLRRLAERIGTASLSFPGTSPESWDLFGRHGSLVNRRGDDFDSLLDGVGLGRPPEEPVPARGRGGEIVSLDARRSG